MAERGICLTPKDFKKEVRTELKAEEHKLLARSQISLVLDDYTDIFSDFDSRPYSHRALSQDFLEECERASKDKFDDGFELSLMMPAGKRNHINESMIKRRLHEHFKKHSIIVSKEASSLVRSGFKFFLGGVIMMLLATYISYMEYTGFLFVFLGLLFEPGGWFLFWEGLYQILFETKKLKPKMNFYNKMSKVDIKFSSY